MVIPALPAVVIAAIRSTALQQLSLGLGSSIAAGALLKTFDDTSKNICKCLDKIDRTLIDGFAGLGIETQCT